MIPLLALATAAFVQVSEAAPPPTPPNGAGRSSLRASVDYPPEALRRHEEGRVGFEIVVSPEGRVSDCRVTESSGSEALDRGTCELMRARALFRAARDTQGNPIAETVHSSIRWVLPH
jgi:protein TonB